MAEGQSVIDQVGIAWSADGQALIAESRATLGDRFVATSRLAHDRAADRFHFEERNNGRWPVRRMVGTLEGRALTLHEHEPDRRVRLVLTLDGPDGVVVEEALHTAQGWQAPFVRIRYQRSGTGPTCAR